VDIQIENFDSPPLQSSNPLHPNSRVSEVVQQASIEDPYVYYRFGVIDFLQDYTKKKKLETMYLRRRYKKKDPNCFSCVEPTAYADRFYYFLSNNLFTPVRQFPKDEIPSLKGGSAGHLGESISSVSGS
jgi:hypothetical protein